MLRQQTATSPEDRKTTLAGLAAYQAAPRLARPDPAPVMLRHGRALLRNFARDAHTNAPDILFVPSLINPPDILDLSPSRSLVRWLARRGFRPLLLDWGRPDADARAMDVSGHITDLLIPLIERLDRPPILVGYCLGGTMAAAAACVTPVAALATIAAPWRFGGFDPHALGEIAALWAAAEPLCRAMGLVPMEVLQSGFWQLDPARTIAKYRAFAALDPASVEAQGFVTLEDWANAGAPLTYAAGTQMFEDFFGRDTPGRGLWTLSGIAADPLALTIPRVEFVSLTDRIVPAASAAGFADRRQSTAGHVGMVVGRRAQSALWEPLADWLTRVCDAT